MDQDSLTLHPADDLAYVECLLESAGLPTADVRSKPDCFYTARADGGSDTDRQDGDRAGVGGVEVHGRHGLLRSVVVDPTERGTGVGTALCAALEDEARESRVETLWVLTTTAAEFFAGRGYERVERSTAPDTIRGTTQFADLCPSSATVLRRRL